MPDSARFETIKVGDLIDGKRVKYVLGADDVLVNQVTMNRDGSVVVRGLYVTATSAERPDQAQT